MYMKRSINLLNLVSFTYVYAYIWSADSRWLIASEQLRRISWLKGQAVESCTSFPYSRVHMLCVDGSRVKGSWLFLHWFRAGRHCHSGLKNMLVFQSTYSPYISLHGQNWYAGLMPRWPGISEYVVWGLASLSRLKDGEHLEHCEDVIPSHVSRNPVPL